MADPSTSEKAYFTNVHSSKKFYVQFNPKGYTLTDKATWKASNEQQKQKPVATYEKGEQATISMDLFFDTTDTGENVNERFVDPLRDFLSPGVTGTYEEGPQKDKKWKRPPFCTFTWGTFSFDCVVTSVAAEFMMFSVDGTPLRARVTVSLTERGRAATRQGDEAKVTLTWMGSSLKAAPESATTYKTKPGDTTSSVAAKTGADAKHIATANNVKDPMSLEVGIELVIPANAELAEMMAKQAMRQAPNNWSTDRRTDPTEAFQWLLDSTAPTGFTDFPPTGVSLANAFLSFDAPAPPELGSAPEAAPPSRQSAPSAERTPGADSLLSEAGKLLADAAKGGEGE